MTVDLTIRERNWLGDQGQHQIELKFDRLQRALRILGWTPGGCFCPPGSRRHTDACVAARAELRDGEVAKT